MKFNILLCLILCFTQGCKKAEDNSSEGLVNHHKSKSFEFKIGKVIIKTELAVFRKEERTYVCESMDEEKECFSFLKAAQVNALDENTRILQTRSP